MENTHNNSAVQSRTCARCGTPGAIPTIHRKPDDPPALVIAFVDNVPVLICRRCRAALADQRRARRAGGWS